MSSLRKLESIVIDNPIRVSLQISTQRYRLLHIDPFQKHQNLHNIHMASPNNFDFPHFPPAPPLAAKTPSHLIPPPPHTIPLPPHVVQPPPPSSPDNHLTVIVIVFVSFGGLFFFAFLAIGLCCFIKKKKKKTVQETDIIHVDEHLKVKEAAVPGPHGTQAVVLSIEEDVHIDEERRKSEKVGEGLHVKSADDISSALEEGTSASGSSHKNNLEHKAQV